MSRERHPLPLTPTPPSWGFRHGNRSLAVCQWKCGNECDLQPPNRSANPTFEQVVERALSRRSVLQGGLAGGALVIGSALARPARAASSATSGAVGGGFEPVLPNKLDAVVIPDGFRQDLVIRWGDAVTPDAPVFDIMHQTPEAAARQWGYNNDYLCVLQTSATRGLLVCNHEFTSPELMFPVGSHASATMKRVQIECHGMSVIEVRRHTAATGRWTPVPVKRTIRNRRITGTTPFRVVGPAAGDPRLRTAADPDGATVLGTLNNCAGGTTPWGTVLSGEENFNQYFDRSGTLDSRYTASYARYTITGAGTRGWSEVDPRFDLTTEPHEPFRFGWIVEVDPYDPTSTPRKHTMLGRLKHEGANVALTTSGRVVAYMGDDQINEYLYKFVTRDTVRRGGSPAARKHNLGLLEHGTLYVARFSGDQPEACDPGVPREHDGTGEWIPLTSDTQSYVAGMSVADVLIDTRIAGDLAGATKMDRPEDVEPNPVNGKVYAALTKSPVRGVSVPVDAANPVGSSLIKDSLATPPRQVTGNRNGYVLELTEDDDRSDALTFAWSLMLVCGLPEDCESYFAGYPKEEVSPISCPDNVAFDHEGNLWLSTDGNVLGSNDGIFRVPVSGPERGFVKQFLTVPPGAEASGPLVSKDGRTVWTTVQHPGAGGTYAAPISTWPHTDPFARPSVVVTYEG
ncbi:PhoX family protein [Nocardioides sp. GXQ0305]|uniref:PhoX family protein n=1 Tax=Nocardioides sp. GXQ0305 TaxID=3423912 RepID=UPI003D7CA567